MDPTYHRVAWSKALRGFTSGFRAPACSVLWVDLGTWCVRTSLMQLGTGLYGIARLGSPYNGSRGGNLVRRRNHHGRRDGSQRWPGQPRGHDQQW